MSSNQPGKRVTWRVGVLLAFSIILSAASVLGVAIAPGWYRPTSSWSDYYTIVTPLPSGAADAALARAGIDGVISAASEEVAITDFAGLSWVRVVDLDERLDPRDPRRDPYVAGVSGYFTTFDDEQRYSILYAPREVGAAELSRAVETLLGAGSVVIDWRPLPTIVSLLVFGGAVGLALGMIHRGGSVSTTDRVTAIAGVVPWVPFVVFGGVVAAAVAGAIYYVWVLVMIDILGAARARLNYGRRIDRATRIRAVWLLVATGASLAYAASVGATAILAPLGIAAGGSIGVAGVGLFVVMERRRRQDHRLFLPVPIMGRRVSALGAPLLALAILVLPPLAARLGARAPVPVPRPAAVGRVEPTFAGLSELHAAELDHALPDLSDFVAHVAYQQGLPFGRTYGVPVAGEQVQLTRYEEVEDGSYREYRQTIVTFDHDWLAEVLTADGLPALLLDDGRTSGVVVTRGAELYSRYTQLVQHSVFVFLVFGPFVLSGVRLSRRTTLLGPIKRRQQVA